MLRLLRTTTFSFTIIYVFVFAIAVAGLGLLFYQNTFGVMSKQTDAIINQEMVVLSEVFSTEGAGVLRRVIRERAAWRDDGLYMLIGAPSGAVLSGNLSALPPEALSAGEGFFDFTFERPRLNAAGREVGIETREARGKIRRFKPTPDAETSFLVFVARDISTRESLRKRSQALMTRIGMVTIGLGILMGLVFSRALLRRVDSVNRTARAIRDGDLSKRIALTGAGDELENLALNLNAMLDQIERLMSGMREVSDNIAHDLRSPLNRIRGRLTEALKGDIDARDEALRATLADAENMIMTFNALLSIARIESGEGAGSMEAVDLVAIAQEMVELYEPAAQDAGFVLQLKTAPTPPVRGSRSLISQALANLLDNALKYAVGGETIRIDVRKGSEGRVLLSVLDDGPGVPPAERDSVLKRFVRLEQSRSTPGSGLGLSLVAAIARAHRGAIALGDSKAGDERPGLKVTIAFPAFDKA
ncbi:MAG: HAMP domain-containing sensor histidine kinase [Parvularculaceae bacterium]|nr:HAMP domain-containing histidine kinase [Parvularculaceae bacterium]